MNQDIPRIVQQLLMPFGHSTGGPTPVVSTGHQQLATNCCYLYTSPVTVQATSSNGAPYLPGIVIYNNSCLSLFYFHVEL